jgi:hypothetical protein
MSSSLVTLISFDIDGTLELGDPPGFITAVMVAAAKARGFIVGSCSDRPLSHQQAIWERLAIVPDFTVLKHRLDDVRTQFPDHAYYHIGDTDIDEHYAMRAGFEFLRVGAAAHDTWVPRLFHSEGAVEAPSE